MRRHEEVDGGAWGAARRGYLLIGSIRIHVGVGKATSVDTNPGILLVVLETLSERKVKNKAVDRAERQVHDDTGFIKDQLRRSHGAR